MKLLVLLSRVPFPLEKGDKLRAYHQIRYLATQCELHLVCLNDAPLHPEAVGHLNEFCKSLLIIRLSKTGMLLNLCRAWLKGKPFQVGYFFSFRAKKAILRQIESVRPDHVYCQLLRTAEYVRDVNIQKTLDYQDVFSKGVERRMAMARPLARMILKMEYKRLLKYEGLIFSWFQNKTIICGPDRALIPHPDRKQIHIIPNGVDVDFFHPAGGQKEYEILFTGNMAYPPNVDAAEYLIREIMPGVWRFMPAAKILIAGAHPPLKIRRLESENVHVAGWMEDIREAYNKGKVFVAPMRIGTGLQNKILEAMAMGLPCVTSDFANEALGARPGEEVLCGKNTEDFSQAILTLLKEPERAAAISSKASAFIREHYSWPVVNSRLFQIINNALTD